MIKLECIENGVCPDFGIQLVWVGIKLKLNGRAGDGLQACCCSNKPLRYFAIYLSLVATAPGSLAEVGRSQGVGTGHIGCCFFLLLQDHTSLLVS